MIVNNLDKKLINLWLEFVVKMASCIQKNIVEVKKYKPGNLMLSIVEDIITTHKNKYPDISSDYAIFLDEIKVFAKFFANKTIILPNDTKKIRNRKCLKRKNILNCLNLNI